MNQFEKDLEWIDSHYGINISDLTQGELNTLIEKLQSVLHGCKVNHLDSVPEYEY